MFLPRECRGESRRRGISPAQPFAFAIANLPTSYEGGAGG